ncbi:MAG: sigma-70 family RNA polymerase sigma factor [Acidobacteriaceae bacterium]|nr:sigma-70 family RNA polymerase sigma factor [Acidobacteriaceae bacterium]MBV9679219.1 sigma-70 family RNA polymerase sigma factor [Acidobacteriaceae bacterium]
MAVSMSEEPALNPDCKLVRRLKQRDPQAMMDLYDRYGKLIYSVIFRAVNNSAIAEDITQEAFLRVWNRVGTFDEEKGRFEGWLVTVARNRAFDYLRSMRSSPSVSTVSLDDLERTGFISSNESQSDRIARERTVIAALRNLNREQREVIELTHFEGMSQTEIAQKLQKPLGTVKSLVRSALKSLRTAMVGAGIP